MKKVFVFLTVALCFCAVNKAMAQTVASGTTGDCTWTLTGPAGNYTLTISGNGAMADYDSNNDNSPWYSYKDNIKTLSIQEGVKAIGNYAFFRHEKATGALTIPNSVTTIGERAFNDCDNLTSVHIGASVETISEGAFLDCDELTGTLTIPNSVKTIGDVAFAYCPKLTGTLTIGNSVKTIGERAFAGCYGLTSVIIGSSVETIGFAAFDDCLGLTGTLTIPNTVKTIGEFAFQNCLGLTGALTIPNSVTSIGEAAFYLCSSLTSVTISNSVTTIASNVFRGCSSLTSATIPNSVTTIGGSAFSGCSSLTSVTLPNSVNSIGGSAFNGCSSLTSVTLPNSVTTIGGAAFSGCSSLTSVTLPNSVTTIGASAFRYCSSLTSVTIPNLVTTIEGYAFADCSSLTSVTIPNSVTTIGYAAFARCTGLTSITIPNLVTTIEGYAFVDCTGLTSIMLPNSVTSIGEGAFYSCTGLTSFTIPPLVTAIEEYTFRDCTGLPSITIPNSVTTIGRFAFCDCTGLTDVTVKWTTPPTINTNVFYNVDKSNITLHLPTGATQADYEAAGWTGFGTYDMPACASGTIGEDNAITWELCGGTLTVSGTGPMDFSDISSPWELNNSIINVIIAPGITSIGEYAFSYCHNLESIDIPSTVTAIGQRAFQECSKLASVTIPEDVTVIEPATFFECESLTSIIIPEKVTSIGIVAFQGCPFTSIAIPANVTAIGAMAFVLCDDLESVTFASPSSLTTIGGAAFQGCSSLASIDIPAPVTTIGAEAFASAGLQTVTVHWTTASAIPTITEDVFPFQTPTSQMSPMTLHVPGGTKPLYEAANVWKEFTIVDEQAANTYALTIGTFTGGAVTADKATYAAGETVTLAIAPATGYTLNSISAHKTGEAGITVPLTGTDNTRTFTMPAYDVTIEAAFNAPVTNAQTPVISGQPQSLSLSINTPAVLTVTASVSDNGTLTYQWYGNTGDSNTGGTAITAATANSYSPPTTTAGTSWYYVVVTNTNNSVNGVKTASATSATASVTVDPATGDDDEDDEGEGDEEGEGDDPATPLYTITIAPSANGWVTATPWNAEAGETVTLTITSATGYELASITAHPTGTQSESIALSGSGDLRTFTMPACDVTVTATFRETTPTGTDPSAQTKTLSAYTQNGNLHITGLTVGQPWRIYSITGKLVVNKTALTGEAEISLPTRGGYIVQSGKNTIKIVY